MPPSPAEIEGERGDHPAEAVLRIRRPMSAQQPAEQKPDNSSDGGGQAVKHGGAFLLLQLHGASEELAHYAMFGPSGRPFAIAVTE